MDDGGNVIDSSEAPALLVKAGTLIDGTGSTAARDVEVLVDGGAIAAVGPIGSVHPPPDTREIDASSGTVIPGLVDAHHHVSYSGHLGMQELEWPRTLESSAINAAANAARALACGYTSAFDVGCRGAIGVAARSAVAAGTIAGPRLRVSGQILTTLGGPLDAWPSTMRFDPAARLTVVVSGADEIRRAIREQAKGGVDNVKLQLSWSTVQPRGRGRSTTFTPEELVTATQLAHHHGLSIAAHAEGPESIVDAIAAGFDTVQHASFIDDPTIGLLDSHPGCRLVFTLGVYDDIRANGPLVGYSASGVARVNASWDAMVAGVRLAYERGVPFAVGSDCGGMVHPHGRYARDIVLLVRACGIPVEHAIAAATDNAARAAWLSDVGRIVPGAEADLVVVEGDLSSQIERLEDEANIGLVIQRGRIVKGVARANSSRSDDPMRGAPDRGPVAATRPAT